MVVDKIDFIIFVERSFSLSLLLIKDGGRRM